MLIEAETGHVHFCSKLSEKMVRLHVKKGEESQFLYDTHVEARVEDIIYDITIIYNGRLKVSRICYGNGRSYLAKAGGNQIEKDDMSNSVAKEKRSPVRGKLHFI